MSSLLKNLLISLGIAIVLWLGYMIFFNSDNTPALTSSSGSVSEQAELETQQLLLDIQKLNSYNLSGAIFTDPRFMSLQNFRTPIPEEPAGRSNPFAPVQ